jgi:pimeloyl-ACP methyl ester carboxylesterase
MITFDGRGNGRSDRPTQAAAYAESEFAADAIAVMDTTQTAHAIIVGFSMGAQRALLLAASHPDRILGAAFICPSYQGGGEPLPERLVYSWEDELDTDVGWAKYNRRQWLQDYQGFLKFFFSRMFTEPHSTKPIEDGVGWGLDTTGETLALTHQAPDLQPKELRELAGASPVSSPGDSWRIRRHTVGEPWHCARGTHRRPSGASRRLQPCAAHA